jgi:hypothetical protein
MVYKVTNGNVPQRGPKPSKLTKKVTNTLALLDPKDSFTVWKRANLSVTELQKRLSTIACVYENRTGKRYSTKSYSHFVKVTRVV